MINPKMPAEEREHILQAAESHIRNYSAIVYEAHSYRGSFIGSATCIEIGQRLFLASAAHNFHLVEHGGEVGVFSAQKGTRPPLVSVAQNYSEFGKKNTLDLAWIELDQDSAARSNLQGLPISSLDPFHSVQSSLCYTIAGFPGERVSLKKTKDGGIFLNCEVVMYISIPVPPTITGDHALWFDYPADAISLDGPPVPYPGGMSGGGIWAAPIEDSSTIWVPRFQLVAITTDYDPPTRTVRALYIHEWLEFFLKDHPELKEHIEPLVEKRR